MKTPITLAKKLQKKGITVSFWFYSHNPEFIEVNIHTAFGEPSGGIKTKGFKKSTQKEISEFLSSFLTEENEEK